MRLWLLSAFAVLGTATFAQQQTNPFAPPRASLHYAPDRTCDLINVDITIDVDYPNRTFSGAVVNTMAPLRSGIGKVMLMAGEDLTIRNVTVDGRSAGYKRDGKRLFIDTPGAQKGRPMKIQIGYAATNSKGRPFGGGGGGWHWIEPRNDSPNHVGFWTQGETESNSEWVPTWDYPNDLATSESRCTVQADWDVIGNGLLMSTKLSPDKKRKTYDWKLDQPHATYLLTLCGGPFDIKKDSWEGVQLWYVVPRGEGYLIDDSFGHTKDMLSFYSSILGVKYPWPKYAQDAMYDFGGGMENASATTLGEPSLTEARNGYFTMDSLNSHELGHQWFGDLVTCKDWGDTWLNESFATYMQDMYFEHSRGKDAYDWEIDDNMRGYFGEARRYKRPLSTKMYPNGDAMFDQHTYPKGGAILHTLRRQLGDESFFSGLNYYLKKWYHTPVESAQLRRAFIEATGINVEPFWAQWIEKPGHPVLDYTWSYANGAVSMNVKQTQDTSDGTPIYDIPAKVDFIYPDGKHVVAPIHLSKADETFAIPAAQPAAVVLDPTHDFLRQIPDPHWTATELPFILRFGMNAPDRSLAMQKLLDAGGDANVQLVAEVVAQDMGREPAFRNVNALMNLAKPELRSFWMRQLSSPNFDRQAVAVQALGKLPADAATTAMLRSLVNDKAPIRVVVNSINALAAWDKAGNADVFRKAQQIKDRRGVIKRAADAALGVG
jgi:aminopeptidase N